MTITSAYTKAIITVHNLKSLGTESMVKLDELKAILKSKLEGNFLIMESNYADSLRKKTKLELVRLSGAVCGIEFCYAAETAFVSPTLLGLGLQKSFMTLMWCFSPIIGILLSPVLGSLSDNCNSSLGRRRPFIILLSLFILCGLVLTPNGKDIGYLLGDPGDTPFEDTNATLIATNETEFANNSTSSNPNASLATTVYHRWGIVFTVIGTVLLDFGSDACQSPARTYLLDVTADEDHTIGLSMFTVMAGLGGSMGYAMGGINWEMTSIGEHLGGHVRAVFTFVAILFVILVLLTITSFAEIPLYELRQMNLCENSRPKSNNSIIDESESASISAIESINYGMFESCNKSKKPQDTISILAGSPMTESMPASPNNGQNQKCQFQIEDDLAPTSWRDYMMSIIKMPRSVKLLCLTNLFCWMSLVCYSLYFTDFVGESVFGGDPDSTDRRSQAIYQDGVRFGCWGMCIYSLSCAAYSVIIERLIAKFGE